MFIDFLDGYLDISGKNNKTKGIVKSIIKICLTSNVNIKDLTLLEYTIKTLVVFYKK